MGPHPAALRQSRSPLHRTANHRGSSPAAACGRARRPEAEAWLDCVARPARSQRSRRPQEPVMQDPPPDGPLGEPLKRGTRVAASAPPASATASHERSSLPAARRRVPLRTLVASWARRALILPRFACAGPRKTPAPRRTASSSRPWRSPIHEHASHHLRNLRKASEETLCTLPQTRTGGFARRTLPLRMLSTLEGLFDVFLVPQTLKSVLKRYSPSGSAASLPSPSTSLGFSYLLKK